MEMRGALVRTTTGMETTPRVDTRRKDSGGKFKSIKEVILSRSEGGKDHFKGLGECVRSAGCGGTYL